MSVENPRYFVYEYDIYIKYIIFVYEYALILTLTLTLTINPNLSLHARRWRTCCYPVQEARPLSSAALGLELELGRCLVGRVLVHRKYTHTRASVESTMAPRTNSGAEHEFQRPQVWRRRER